MLFQVILLIKGKTLRLKFVLLVIIISGNDNISHIYSECKFMCMCNVYVIILLNRCGCVMQSQHNISVTTFSYVMAPP